MEIGVILGAFGIKGEVKILCLRDGPECFLEIKSLLIDLPGTSGIKKEIESVRIHKGHALVKFEGISNRSEAEQLKKCYVRLAGDVSSEEPDEYLERDKLIGIEVYTVSGIYIGVIEEVIVTGANDVYEVCNGEKTVLLPAIQDVIVSVDLESGKMVVNPLPGLL